MMIFNGRYRAKADFFLEGPLSNRVSVDISRYSALYAPIFPPSTLLLSIRQLIQPRQLCDSNKKHSQKPSWRDAWPLVRLKSLSQPWGRPKWSYAMHAYLCTMTTTQHNANSAANLSLRRRRRRQPFCLLLPPLHPLLLPLPLLLLLLLQPLSLVTTRTRAMICSCRLFLQIANVAKAPSPSPSPPPPPAPSPEPPPAPPPVSNSKETIEIISSDDEEAPSAPPSTKNETVEILSSDYEVVAPSGPPPAPAPMPNPWEGDVDSTKIVDGIKVNDTSCADPAAPACDCGIRCYIENSKTEANPERKYYCCSGTSA